MSGWAPTPPPRRHATDATRCCDPLPTSSHPTRPPTAIRSSPPPPGLWSEHRPTRAREDRGPHVSTTFHVSALRGWSRSTILLTARTTTASRQRGRSHDPAQHGGRYCASSLQRLSHGKADGKYTRRTSRLLRRSDQDQGRGHQPGLRMAHSQDPKSCSPGCRRMQPHIAPRGAGGTFTTFQSATAPTRQRRPVVEDQGKNSGRLHDADQHLARLVRRLDERRGPAAHRLPHPRLVRETVGILSSRRRAPCRGRAQRTNDPPHRPSLTDVTYVFESQRSACNPCHRAMNDLLCAAGQGKTCSRGARSAAIAIAAMRRPRPGSADAHIFSGRGEELGGVTHHRRHLYAGRPQDGTFFSGTMEIRARRRTTPGGGCRLPSSALRYHGLSAPARLADPLIAQAATAGGDDPVRSRFATEQPFDVHLTARPYPQAFAKPMA